MSSANSIVSSADSELQAQDWEGLGTQDEAPDALDVGVRGVEIERQTDEVLFGESVIFIPSQSAAAKVCGARVGSNSGKKCIILKNEDDKCTYGTHNTQSPRPAVLEPGFYLRASSPRRDDNHVMAEPIADTTLFNWFGELILSTNNPESAFWLLAITALESAPSKEEGYANFKVVQESVVNVDQGIPLDKGVSPTIPIKTEDGASDGVVGGSTERVNTLSPTKVSETSTVSTPRFLELSDRVSKVSTELQEANETFLEVKTQAAYAKLLVESVKTEWKEFRTDLLAILAMRPVLRVSKSFFVLMICPHETH